MEEEGAGRRICAHCWGGERADQPPTPQGSAREICAKCREPLRNRGRQIQKGRGRYQKGIAYKLKVCGTGQDKLGMGKAGLPKAT